MNDDRDLNRLLDAWFAEGPVQVADRAFDEAVGRVHRQRQRPSWRRFGREIDLTPQLKVVVAAPAVIAVVVAGFAVFGRSATQIGGIAPPTTTPSSAPGTPSPAVVSPTVTDTNATACGLITGAEVGTALNISSGVTPDSQVNGSNSEVGYCVYRAAGGEVLGISYRTSNAQSIFDTWKSGTGVQPVPGLGDEAIWDPTQQTLFILKGSGLATITAVEPTPARTLAAAKAVGTIMVSRM